MAAYIYTSTGGDDGAAIKTLIEDGERWIQSASATLSFDTIVDLRESGVPADGFRFEPATGVPTVSIDLSGIGRDSGDPTNPSFAGFEYDGNFTAASYLTAASSAGDIEITVDDGSQYSVGQWVLISDGSHDPGSSLLPADGTTETRKVIAIAGDVLTCNEILDRDHAIDVIVAHTDPIRDLYFRDISFTGNAASGIHVHSAHDGVFQGITTDDDWRGRTMLLVDHGGMANAVLDSFCNGNEPGTGSTQQAWGVAIEGNKRTRVVRSGGKNCGNGFFVNFCIDCLGVDAQAVANNVNVGIYGGSIRCSIMRPFIGSALALDTYISGDSTDCDIVDIQAYMSPIEQFVAEWRSFPFATSVGDTDSFLIADENDGVFQISKAVVVAREADGTIQSAVMGLKVPLSYGGAYQMTNNVGAWQAGMLGSNPSKDYAIYDLKNGRTALAVLEDGTAVLSYYNVLPGNGSSLDLGSASLQWRDLRLSRALLVAGDQVVGGRGASVSNSDSATYVSPGITYVAPSGGTTVDAETRTALAKLAADVAAIRTSLGQLAVDDASLRTTGNTALARLRTHGLIAS